MDQNTFIMAKYKMHHTWMNSHSLIECIQCAWEDTVRVYNNYNGNFLSMFLTGLTPLAFNENRYHFNYICRIDDMPLLCVVCSADVFKKPVFWKSIKYNSL